MERTMLSVVPYMRHFDEALRCEAGEEPEFFRVFDETNRKPGFGAEWVADFQTKIDADEYVQWRSSRR